MENRMEHAPLLSVIVPIYNAEKYLDRCVTSILKQTFQDLEVILVDDGSADASLQICRSFQERDARVRVVSKENGGLLRARKTGLAHAAGKLIGFVDSDDRIDPDMYAQLVACMEETGAGLVSSGFVREQEGQEPVTVSDHYEEGLYRDPESSVYPTMLYDGRYREFGLHCVLWSKVFRRDLLEKVYADIDEDVFYGEDALACYPYCLLADSIYILHRAYYHYTIRRDSMCTSADERLPYNNYRVYWGLSRAFSAAGPSKWVLLRQLKHYIVLLERHNLLHLYHVNTGAMELWDFGYPEELFDKKFVLYGAGTCGQALYGKICREHREANMVCWADREAGRKTEECAYPLQEPDVLAGLEWDVLVLAVQSRKLAEQIKDSLCSRYGIRRDRMYWAAARHGTGPWPAEDGREESG